MNPVRAIRQFFQCTWRAAYNTVMLHDGVEHAGYLAFLSLLALFPFLVLLVSVIGVIGQGENGAEFIRLLLARLPGDITVAVQPRIVEIISGPPQGLLTVSILGAIWTASSAVEGLRTILNRAYHVTTPPAYWFRRSMSILQLLIFTSIMIFGILLVLAIPLMLRHIEERFGFNFLSGDEHLFSQVIYLLTIGLLFCAISYIYYVIPNIKQRFISVAPGAGLVVALWIIAAQVFTLYLSNFNQMNLIYGSLGGVIAALLFSYICNIIFIFGAEFNYQLVETLGLRVVQRETTSTSASQNKDSLG